jgi:hypothetical protein
LARTTNRPGTSNTATRFFSASPSSSSSPSTSSTGRAPHSEPDHPSRSSSTRQGRTVTGVAFRTCRREPRGLRSPAPVRSRGHSKICTSAKRWEAVARVKPRPRGSRQHRVSRACHSIRPFSCAERVVTRLMDFQARPIFRKLDYRAILSKKNSCRLFCLPCPLMPIASRAAIHDNSSCNDMFSS